MNKKVLLQNETGRRKLQRFLSIFTTILIQWLVCRKKSSAIIPTYCFVHVFCTCCRALEGSHIILDKELLCCMSCHVMSAGMVMIILLLWTDDHFDAKIGVCNCAMV